MLKRTLLLGAILCGALAGNVVAGDFASIEDALSEASKQGKPLLVDFYTQW